MYYPGCIAHLLNPRGIVMTLLDYVYCGILAMLGLLFAILLQLKSQSDKAKLANLVVPTFGTFVHNEWITISLSIVTIIIALFLIPIIIDLKPGYVHYIRPAFLPIGYAGTDILLKLFGVVNKRLNAAIDYKTTIADTQTGTTAAPTPADAPKP
jgi:hypothetical protein